jgi:LuxR family maltose regulon positive regulatory protein
LNEGLNRKLTVICAPAGYGKTTLLSQWLADSEHPIAWLTLDENDNDLFLFLGYFLAAINTIFPNAGQDILSLLSGPQKPPLEVITSTFINELNELDEPFSLVLDDYHAITNAEVHQWMEAFIAYIPSGMHVVLVSRRDVPLPLVRLRISREITELRVIELRLTPEETKAYLEQTTGMKLSSDVVTLLETRTEGWIAALRLVAIAMRTEDDHKHFVKSFKGSHRDLMDYLVSEVIAQQPEEVQNFLLKTSILSRYCAPLAQAVTGNSKKQIQEIIEWLEYANLFIIPLDDDGNWYRYHHLFREMLYHRLKAKHSQNAITVLHNNASLWLGKNDFIDEAIRHSMAAEDVGSAIALIDQHRHDLLDQSNWRVFERWLNILPSDVAGKEPTLLVMQAWLLLHLLKLDEMNLALGEAEKRLAKIEAQIPKSGALALRGEIDTMHSYFWNVAGNDPQKGFKCAQRALKNLPQTHSFARGMALDFECFAFYFSGQKDKAIRLLTNAAYHPTNLGPSKLQTFIGLCHLYLVSGDLPQLLHTAEDFLQMVMEKNQSIGIAYAHYFIGYARYERNELEMARHHFSQVADMTYGASTIVYKNCMYALALIHQVQGKSDKAQETMDALQSYFREIKNSTFLPEIRSVQARLSLVQGELDSAVRWAQSINPSELRDSPFVFEVQHITWASVRIAQGTTSSLQKAIHLLVKMLTIAEATNNTRWMIKILVHLALAYQAQGKTKDSLEVLERAVKLAQPGGFIRTFVDSGVQMAGMLRQLLNRGVSVQYIQLILAAFPECEASVDPMVVDPAITVSEISKTILLEALTRRESEVLLHLAERRTNQEIAEGLTISILTVKKHTGNIYQKLGVNSRAEAVEKAKALGILSAK